MRRTDREVTELNDIADILNRSKTLRLGLQGDQYPYIVPLSFGFTAKNGQITIYAHGAKDGLKHTLLAKNNHVCIETDIFHTYMQTERGITVLYESVIGVGKGQIITGNEAEIGMEKILRHCGFEDFAYDKKLLERITILRVDIVEITGKRHIL